MTRMLIADNRPSLRLVFTKAVRSLNDDGFMTEADSVEAARATLIA